MTGNSKERLAAALLAARKTGQPVTPDYAYYPQTWLSPYKERRKSCGLALYQALGIQKGDSDAQQRAWNNNYTFFGAPVGLMFTLHKAMQTGSWLDLGMFLQNIMLAALEFGLATCPQASLAEYPAVVRDTLGLDAQQYVICGMALGYPDKNHPVNQYRLPREPASAFSHWHD